MTLHKVHRRVRTHTEKRFTFEHKWLLEEASPGISLRSGLNTGELLAFQILCVAAVGSFKGGLEIGLIVWEGILKVLERN